MRCCIDAYYGPYAFYEYTLLVFRQCWFCSDSQHVLLACGFRRSCFFGLVLCGCKFGRSTQVSYSFF